MNEKEILLSIFKSKVFYVSLAMLGLLFIFDLLGIGMGQSSSLGLSALNSAIFQTVSMLKIVPPIFLLIGLLDVWVPKETMIKLMGEGSGPRGIGIAFFLGAMSAGPLIAAFPVAQIMLKKGARYANALFFIMIWASAKLPILFYQATTMGLKFTLVSNLTLITIYLFGTHMIEGLLSHEEKQNIYAIADGA